MPSIHPKRNVIEGRVERDGLTIRYNAIWLDRIGMFHVLVVDHFRESTNDFARPHEVYGAIGELVEAALAGCRARAQQLAQVA